VERKNKGYVPLSLSEEAALEKELKEKVQSHGETTENDEQLSSMKDTDHDINETSDAELEAELENTQPSDKTLKLT
ncbi:MAG TPA: conjugative transfer protein TraD, partial [Rickettsia endosymbiont of Bembidion nr. Transversale]|nr:conjugative transfer protein TraD [Rickettsia endosymbiont of Bembidion nr. Transversale]